MDSLATLAAAPPPLDDDSISYTLDFVYHNVKHLRPLSPTASDTRRNKRLRIMRSFQRLQHTMNNDHRTTPSLFPMPLIDDGDEDPLLDEHGLYADDDLDDGGAPEEPEDHFEVERSPSQPAGTNLDEDIQDAGNEPSCHEDSDADDAIPASRIRRKRCPALGVSKRVALICAAFTMESVPPEDVPALMSPLRTGTHAKVEDAALMVLCRGYQLAPQTTWDELLLPEAHQLATSHEYRTNSQQLDLLEDTDQRLIQRHEVLAQMTVSQGANQWLVRLMKHIETLKFAIDWNLARGKGSKSQKTFFYQQTFSQQSHLKETFAGLSPKEIAATIRSDYAQEYKDWKRSNETTVTARNRLLSLYCIFGSSTLIDSVWTVDDLATHRSRDFMKVLACLRDNIPACEEQTPLQRFLDGHRRGRRVLLAILQALGAGTHVEDHILEFFDEHPPTYQLLAGPDGRS